MPQICVRCNTNWLDAGGRNTTRVPFKTDFAGLRRNAPAAAGAAGGAPGGAPAAAQPPPPPPPFFPFVAHQFNFPAGAAGFPVPMRPPQQADGGAAQEGERGKERRNERSRGHECKVEGRNVFEVRCLVEALHDEREKSDVE